MNIKMRSLLNIVLMLSVALGLSCDTDGAWFGTPKVIFNTQPSDVVIYESQIATFSTLAVGPDTIIYSWEVSDDGGLTWAAAVGDLGVASYITPAAAYGENGNLYRVKADNGTSSAYSESATLSVLPMPYRIIDLSTDTVSTALSVPDLLTNDEYKTTKIVLKLIQAGSFNMGDEQGVGDADELPVHRVNITKPFYMGVFEVTQKQWAEVTGTWPSTFSTTPDKLPVETISWNDCQTYLTTISSSTSFAVRLPTEAEWEYACKAGTNTIWSHGNVHNEAYLWSFPMSSTEEVGIKLPNPWGLYDMHGHVNEYCQDYYATSYVPGEVDDPTGPITGTEYAVRGGTIANNPEGCRSSGRLNRSAVSTGIATGFRIAGAVPLN